MDTATQARDMDAIRAAQDEEKISYFGNSHGGVLGASYARLFPQRELVIAAGSVKIHVSHVLAKIGVRTRVQAAIYAYRSGLVSPDE